MLDMGPFEPCNDTEKLRVQVKFGLSFPYGQVLRPGVMWACLERAWIFWAPQTGP